MVRVVETWRQNPSVAVTEERLLRVSPSVLGSFCGQSVPKSPPHLVRTVLWQYWFTGRATKHATGAWWRREMLGGFAPGLFRQDDGTISVIESTDTPLVAPPE